MDEIVQEFVTEATESLAILDLELVRFEQDPSDKKILGNIFRLLHTIKGTCGFIGLSRLEKLAHAGEDVLGKYRDETLPVSEAGVTVVLRCIDTIRTLIADLAATGAEPSGDDGTLIADLRELISGTSGREESEPDLSTSRDHNSESSADSPQGSGVGFPVAAELLAEVEAAMAAKAQEHSATSTPESNRGDLPAPLKSGPAAAGVPVIADTTLESIRTSPSNQSAQQAQPIRVSVEVLESLMTLVSELVLTRNQLLQISRSEETSAYRDPILRLNRITSDLQEGVMKTRMQPVGNAWTKLPRIVRDLAHEMGKKISFVMEGETTEIDRQVLELIKDPLTHMVRNSADHGLETPDERRAHGKPEQGTIRLMAFHEGGNIVIRIEDDGRGLNTGRIREKIVEKGLGTHDEVAAMSDDEVHDYILKPGFSTAAKVTNVSGRGVGMDVVKTNIEKIGGAIEFKSKQLEGTCFSLKIPLTLAIVPALMINCCGERYAIPQVNVQEVVRANGRAQHRVETINGAPVLRLRNRLLPLIRLDNLLGLTKESEPDGRADKRCFVVVVHNRDNNFGIIADGIDSSEEIVVKPVPSQFREVTQFSGITIMGDGSLVLILDLNNLDQHLESPRSTVLSESDVTSAAQKLERILLFKAGGAGQKGVLLSEVERIEALHARDIESIQGESVIQYRGGLMRVVDMDEAPPISAERRYPLLVFGKADDAVGLRIESIVDVVEDRMELAVDRRRDWAIGSAVLGGKATDIVDPRYFLPMAFGAQGPTGAFHRPAG